MSQSRRSCTSTKDLNKIKPYTPKRKKRPASNVQLDNEPLLISQEPLPNQHRKKCMDCFTTYAKQCFLFLQKDTVVTPALISNLVESFIKQEEVQANCKIEADSLFAEQFLQLGQPVVENRPEALFVEPAI